MPMFTAATLQALSGRPCSEEQAEEIHAWVLDVITEVTGPLDDPPPAGVTGVAKELGRAAVPAPGGAASQTIGPYSATYADTSTRYAVLTAEQRARLRRAVHSSTCFSIDTVVTE